MGEAISAHTELAESPAIGDWLILTDISDTTQSVNGTTKKNKGQYGLGSQVNAQTGTTYTYLTTDFRKLVTHTNAASIAGTLPQAGASFPAGWYMLVQNRGAGALTITPTTSTIDGAATLVLNQNEGTIIVSDGTNYFTLRGKATGAAGVGDVAGPGSATDNAIARFDGTTGKLIQNSTVTVGDTGAVKGPTQIEDSNGNEVVKFGTTASAVNEVTITNKATGTGPTVEATGSDTNIDLALVSKGSGVVKANGVNVLLESLEVYASDLTTALTTGTSKGVFWMPFAMTVTEVFAALATPQTSGSIFTVDINEAGVSILSTKITIDNTEDTSLTAATPPVLSDTALAKGAKITIDIDQVGDGTAKGLVVVVTGVRG